MQLIYRGQYYKKPLVPATTSKIKFPCVYRGVPYQMKSNFSYKESAPKESQLTYRGVPYRLRH
ncbi:MAG: DUF4278 domain-containing protein [Phormidesmis sp.]